VWSCDPGPKSTEFRAALVYVTLPPGLIVWLVVSAIVSASKSHAQRASLLRIDAGE
jgi:hypothetical protein